MELPRRIIPTASNNEASRTASQAVMTGNEQRREQFPNVKPLVILSKYYPRDWWVGVLNARSVPLFLHRIGIVCLLSAAFAGAFASIVHYSSDSRARAFDSGCRVSTNPACFGPNLR
jgi:hypothetical protein